MSSSSEPPIEDDQAAEFAAIEAELGPDPAGPDPVPPEPAPPEIDTAELVAQVIGPGFALLAPAWNVQPEEIKALSEAYGALIDKYFPGGLGPYGVEVSALLVTLAVIGPRLAQPRKLPATPEAAAPADPGQVPPAPSGESKSMLEP